MNRKMALHVTIDILNPSVDTIIKIFKYRSRAYIEQMICRTALQQQITRQRGLKNRYNEIISIKITISQ